MTKEEFAELREKFYKALTKKPLTTQQAQEFLERSKVPGKIIDMLIHEAANIGLIDDFIYSRLFIEGHLHWGDAKILYELSARGVSRENINRALGESEPESQRACELAQSWRDYGLDDRKIAARLRSRGFTNRAINAIKDSLE
ncbi:MAG: RecX family transcriptional regulator [Synergistaceae bacterium]|nr:RecX family transcriptional regulator [Synergistaceae bacterium]